MDKKKMARDIVTGAILISVGLSFARSGTVRLLRVTENLLKTATVKLEVVSQ